MTSKTQTIDFDKNAKQVIKDLRRVREDAQRRLDAFTVYVENLATYAESEEFEPRQFSTFAFGSRVMQELENISHIHTGSSDHAHYRDARDNVLRTLAGEEVY